MFNMHFSGGKSHFPAENIKCNKVGVGVGGETHSETVISTAGTTIYDLLSDPFFHS